MNYSRSDIDSLAAKLEAMTEGERAALSAALLPDEEVEGFGADELGVIRGFVKWDSIMSGPISGGDLGRGRIMKDPIANGDLGSGRFVSPGDVPG